VLKRAMGNTNTQNSPWPGLGGSHHLPPYSILCTSPQGPHPNGFPSGSPEITKVGTPTTLGRHNFACRPRIEKRSEQSCRPRRDLSNCMLHAIYMHGNRVDSRLLVVGSQIINFTPSPSFGHNLCFKFQMGNANPF